MRLKLGDRDGEKGARERERKHGKQRKGSCLLPVLVLALVLEVEVYKYIN